jgi:CheY-like chemotaxis protein
VSYVASPRLVDPSQQRRTLWKDVRRAVAPAVAFRPLARVLVSDDDPAIRAIYGAILTDHGFEYHGAPAGEGQATLELAQALRPQLLITDLNKPGLDGYALRAALRADPLTAPTPVLLVSAIDPWSDPRRPRLGPLDDYLVKPFLAETLIYKVANLLALNAAAQDRLVERASRLPCYEHAHPVTGLPCLHILDRGLPAATAAPGWAALGVSLAPFTRLVRAIGRPHAEGLLARLGSIVATVAGDELLVGHTGFAPQLALVGPAARVAAMREAICVRFAALRWRAVRLWPDLPPLHLDLRQTSDASGLGLGLLALRAALRGGA